MFLALSYKYNFCACQSLCEDVTGCLLYVVYRVKTTLNFKKQTTRGKKQNIYTATSEKSCPNPYCIEEQKVNIEIVVVVIGGLNLSQVSMLIIQVDLTFAICQAKC